MGVEGVQVEEVFGMDEEFFDTLGEVYGLIFLFQWRDDDTRESDIRPQEGDVPKDLFFMNQVIDNACGTQALLSIALNHPKISVKRHLQTFKDFTMPLMPPHRGLCLTNSHIIRMAHNSFARQTDLPVLEYRMQEEQPTSTQDGKKSKKQRELEAEEAKGDAPFHYVSYVPVNGVVWEMDGLKRKPWSKGNVPEDGNWISVVKPVIQARMNAYENEAVRFCLMAIIPDRRAKLRTEEKEAATLEQMAASCIRKRKPDWTEEEGKANMDVDNDVPPEIMTPDALESLESEENLTRIYRHSKRKRQKAARSLMEEVQKREGHAVDNARRRYNYGPFVRRYLELLHKQERLLPLVKENRY
ncbi:hypothetical protein HDV00_007317 [Rhizophlyctis rosea]|nr:hypothetical protein HDV00_007317 [Rhizophlyctis rosea]